jgi:Spy/CpxP family protein refolding chaperone
VRATLLLTVTALSTAAPLSAQHEHMSPYADQHSAIASLSEQELAALRAGEGMGLARAAELNHYPGPRHVLDMADSLGLTSAQRSDLEEIRAKMSDQAVRIGEGIIEKEAELSRRFEHGHIDEESLRPILSELGTLQADLRFTHLAAHLQTRAVLTPEQIEAYDRLRGYAEPTAG